MPSRPLISLLETNEIAHPTSVRQRKINNRQIVLDLYGWPWWLTHDERKSVEYAYATLEFSDVSRVRLTESCLFSDGFNEDLDSFHISKLADATWNQGSTATIFCSETVPDPNSLLLSLDCFLAETDCPFERSEFLNCGDDIRRFIELTKSASFQMANGPEAICKHISEDLQKQKVKHNLLQTEHRYITGFLVEWWDGYLVCGDARISWNEGGK